MGSIGASCVSLRFVVQEESKYPQFHESTPGNAKALFIWLVLLYNPFLHVNFFQGSEGGSVGASSVSFRFVVQRKTHTASEFITPGASRILFLQRFLEVN